MMKAAVLLLLFAASALSQYCSLSSTGVSGTYSKSGVYTLFRSQCPIQYSQQLTGGRFTFQVDSISDNLLTLESNARVTPYQIAAQLYVFVLIDASGSQAPNVNTTAATVKRYINSAMTSNGFQNVSVATAYFDGSNNFTLIGGWTDFASAADQVASQFNTDSFVPTDSATNFYGAYLEAHNYLTRKIATVKPLEVVPTGLIILASDGYDTAGSVRPTDLPAANSRFRTVVFGGPNYNQGVLSGLAQDSGGLVVNISSSQADNNTFTYFQNLAVAYNQTNQGYWLAKYCSPSRPVTRDWRSLGELTDPNIRSLTIGYTNASGVVGPFKYNATLFTKGCNVDAPLSMASALTMSLALLLLLALLF